MAMTSSIQAFFTPAKNADTRWWTWLVVGWFGLIIWFYGQMIFGIPMAFTGMIADPGAIDTYMAAQADKGPNIWGELALLGVFLFSLLAFIAYMIRNQFSANAKRILCAIAAVLAILTFGLFIYMTKTSSGGGDVALLNAWIKASPFVYLFMLLTFPPMAIGLWLGVKYVQKRTVLSLHTAHKQFRWRRMVFAMLVVWIIAALISYGAHLTGASPTKLVFDPARFWKYLPITLCFIPLQSASEEIALRGYLNQSLGKYIKNPWIVFVITSAGFAALHLGNPEVAETLKEHSIWVAMSGYFFFGIFACILTYIDGGLEAAIGMHAANNMFAAAIVGYENSALPTPTIFKVGLNTELDSIMVLVSLSLVCLIMYITRKPLLRPDPVPSTSLADEFD